ncbi:MAG: hypothetical protein ABI167_12385 [Nitrosospira sp.]
MKFSPILSAKSLALASVLLFGSVGIVHAQGYDQGGSMQQPSDSTQSGASEGASNYGTKRDDQKDSSRRSDDSRQPSTDSADNNDDLYQHSSADGTGPRLKGRY